MSSFYDDFLESKMLKYRIYGNKRIDIASEMIMSELKPEDHVLELGCGSGIITERIAKSLDRGHVWACDISERMILYARKTIDCTGVTFFQCDVVDDFERISDRIPHQIDLVVLADVIEHLPPASLRALVRRLDDLTSEQSRLLLTFPSPEYQDFLRQERPEALQPIDRDVELEELVEAVSETRWLLTFWAYKDVWMTNQYIHVRLEKGVRVSDVQPDSGIIAQLRRLLRTIVDPVFKVPVRRWRYGKHVLEKLDGE